MTKILIAGLVAIHLAASVWHGSAHTQLAIALPPDKNAFVYVVILIAPVVAAGLVWTRYISIGLMDVLPLHARRSSLRRVSPLRVGVARQHCPSAERQSGISLSIHR